MRALPRPAFPALVALSLLSCGGGGGGGGGGTPVLFFPASLAGVGVGSDPAATAVADVSEDGIPDVVVALRGASSVAVLLGIGNGAFSGALLHPLGAGVDPAALTVGQIDGDGRPDVAVVDAVGDTVTVLRGTGGGSLSSIGAFALPAGAEPSAIASADFDFDGRVDLAVANRDLSSVSVAWGVGDGTFDEFDVFPLGGGFRPAALVTGDFDRDGRPDLAAASGAEGRVAVLRGRGDRTFRDAVESAAGSGARFDAVAAADVDRDGRLDLLATDAVGGALVVLLGNGDGTFAPGSQPSAGPHPTALALGDVDRDGALDVAVAIFGTGGISVLLGRGDGTFETGARFGSAGSGGAGIALGDLDANGSLDVAVANQRSGDVGILLGRPHPAEGTFSVSARVSLPAGHAPEGAALADVDRDGRLDLLVASRGDDALSVALGAGGGAFALPFDVALAAGSGPVAVAVADFDRDGRPDVAVANADGDAVAVRSGDGTGGFVASDTVAMGGGAEPVGVSAADVDRDGRLDLVVALRGTDRVAVALGHGDGTFEDADPFDVAAGFEPVALAVADFDRDGFLDVAVAGAGSSDVAVLLGDFFLGLSPPLFSAVAPGAEPAGAALADFDLDGRLDLAVPDRLGDAVRALLGAGDGTFLAGPAAATGAGPTAAAADDLDRDGLSDVVAARFASDRLRVLFGSGDGSFSAGDDLGTGGDGPVALLLADLDLDGALDLLAVHRGSDEVVVHLGR